MTQKFATQNHYQVINHFDVGQIEFELLSRGYGLNKPKSDIPAIEVIFADGQKDKFVLKHFDALPHSTNTDHTEICNYLGHLKNEIDASVAVTGCADKRNKAGKMFLTLISKRSPYQKYFSMDFNGHVESIQVKEPHSSNFLEYRNLEMDLLSRETKEFIEGDEIGDTEEESRASAVSVTGGGNHVPYAIKARIKLGIDESARKTITNKLKSNVDTWLAEMLTHLQAHYHHPTLRHRINFKVCLKNLM